MTKIITIAQQKGGSGKTTLAANLAVSFSLNRNLKTTILDADPQGSLGKWFIQRESKLKDKNLIKMKTSSLWGVQYESNSLKDKTDMIIIDTPPKLDADGRPAIQIADLILIPVSPSQVDFWATESIIDLAQREKKKILVVINRANAKSRLLNEAKQFISKMKVDQSNTIIGNRQIFISSMGLGLSAIEKQKSGKGSTEISSLTSEVLSLL
ncbi:MAG: ParA family protein [Proteobacteria bacterium]|jgi:chromosome partitioning protein|nr:ParA family protein [Pseudomonadota bacterium]